jgi:hypothetical protein
LSPVIRKDAVDFPFSRQTLPVFIRPCHSVFFVDRVLKTHREHLIDALYVSKPENLEVDIDTEVFKTEILSDWIGADGEKAYRIVIKEEKSKMIFCLVKNEMGIYWKIPSGDYWMNTSGGRYPKSSDDEVLETVEADDFTDLDWWKTSVVDIIDCAGTGWLSPEGRMYRCGYMEHDFIAYYLFKSEPGELLDKGWIRIEGSGSDSFFSRKKYTPEQLNFLSKNGYDAEGINDPWLNEVEINNQFKDS